MAIEQITYVAPVWSNIALVIIGGFIAAITGFIGAFISYWLGRKSSALNLKREKLEQLLVAAHESDQWLDKRASADLFDETTDVGESPLYRVEVISRLYFPEMDADVLNFSQAHRNYVLWILDGMQEKRSKKKITAGHMEKHRPVYDELLRTLSILTDKASHIMSEIMKSNAPKQKPPVK